MRTYPRPIRYLAARCSLLCLFSFCVDPVDVELHKPALHVRQLCQLVVHLVAQQQIHIHTAQNLGTHKRSHHCSVNDLSKSECGAMDCGLRVGKNTMLATVTHHNFSDFNSCVVHAILQRPENIWQRLQQLISW